jgi:hypothetical protein
MTPSEVIQQELYVTFGTKYLPEEPNYHMGGISQGIANTLCSPLLLPS